MRMSRCWWFNDIWCKVLSSASLRSTTHFIGCSGAMGSPKLTKFKLVYQQHLKTEKEVTMRSLAKKFLLACAIGVSIFCYQLILTGRHKRTLLLHPGICWSKDRGKLMFYVV